MPRQINPKHLKYTYFSFDNLKEALQAPRYAFHTLPSSSEFASEAGARHNGPPSHIAACNSIEMLAYAIATRLANRYNQ